MKKLSIIVAALSLSGFSYADLGIMDTTSEAAAKTEASNLGITQVYDHPGDVANGQFVVPVQYNRTNAEGNGAEFDSNDSKKNDIDYVPLSQLKGSVGATGASGSDGAAGSQGVQGVQGTKGDTGAKGDKGEKGDRGDDGNNRLTLNLGVGVRWYDWKHVSLTSGYRYDVRHFGHTVDMVVFNIKLGRSHEERLLEAQNKKIEALEAALLRLQQ